MKNIIIKIFMLISFFTACKKMKKKSDEKQTTVTSVKKTKTDKSSISLFDMMYESVNLGNKVNERLGGVLSIENASIIVDPKSDKNIYIVFLVKESLVSDDIEKYELQLNMFPFAEDLEYLRDDTHKKNRDYDSWYFKPKIKIQKGRTLIYKKIDTQITEYKQIYVHLYDVNSKKLIEESVIIKNISSN